MADKPGLESRFHIPSCLCACGQDAEPCSDLRFLFCEMRLIPRAITGLKSTHIPEICSTEPRPEEGLRSVPCSVTTQRAFQNMTD